MWECHLVQNGLNHWTEPVNTEQDIHETARVTLIQNTKHHPVNTVSIDPDLQVTLMLVQNQPIQVQYLQNMKIWNYQPFQQEVEGEYQKDQFFQTLLDALIVTCGCKRDEV